MLYNVLMKNQMKTIKLLKAVTIVNAILLLIVVLLVGVLYNGYFNLQEHTNNSINALVQEKHSLDIRIQSLEGDKKD